MVQRRAARFIKRDYSYESSVTQMLKNLDLSSLENRRKMNKLTVLYKIRPKKKNFVSGNPTDPICKADPKYIYICFFFFFFFFFFFRITILIREVLLF